MTLAEKIAALRGARELSQGDLAEALDVSRQSVSKWETGQSVPELDKIIKLADLFGITVDELVRDGDVPTPEPVQTEAPRSEEPEVKIVYVERNREKLTRAQILGVICAVAGIGMGCFAAVHADPEWLAIGIVILAASLPLLLLRKRGLLVCGWIIWALAYLFMCNPALTGVPWQPFWGVWAWCPMWDMAYLFIPVIWLLWLAYVALSALTIFLPIYTARLGWKWWKARKAKTIQEEKVPPV